MSVSHCLVYRGGHESHELDELDAVSNILLESDTFVWLDVVDPAPHDLALIQEEFTLHPLAVEDAIKAHERPKIEAYEGFWFAVVRAASRDADTLATHEIAIFAGMQFIVTVRAQPAYPLDEVRRRWSHLPGNLRRDSGALFYTILDTVVDGYSPIAEAFEERVGKIEAILLGESRRTEEITFEIFAIKEDLGQFRRAVVPVREILAPIMRGDLQLFGVDELPYYRDVYDHVARVVEQLDAARDLVNNARDTHFALTSHRQNEVAKQLTVVATIFLPLSFITGFFGQNFAHLVNSIQSPASFWWLGIGLECITFVALLGYFRHKHWF